jgi:hypothetical protein
MMGKAMIRETSNLFEDLLLLISYPGRAFIIIFSFDKYRISIYRTTILSGASAVPAFPGFELAVQRGRRTSCRTIASGTC